MSRLIEKAGISEGPKDRAETHSPWLEHHPPQDVPFLPQESRREKTKFSKE